MPNFTHYSGSERFYSNPGFSSSAISNIYEKLLKSANDSLYSYLTKAFDAVDYRISRDNLECNYDIRGLSVQLMESYLFYR